MAVSLSVAAGASDLEVAKWAGHSSATFTKSRYAHLFPEHGEALADRLEAFIAASTPTPAASMVPLRRSRCAPAGSDQMGPTGLYAPDLHFLGADDGIRTRDPNLGKVVLYH